MLYLADTRRFQSISFTSSKTTAVLARAVPRFHCKPRPDPLVADCWLERFPSGPANFNRLPFLTTWMKTSQIFGKVQPIAPSSSETFGWAGIPSEPLEPSRWSRVSQNFGLFEKVVFLKWPLPHPPIWNQSKFLAQGPLINVYWSTIFFFLQVSGVKWVKTFN